MHSFRYRAQNENGRRISGRMEAADELDLAVRLKQENLMLISCTSRSSSGGKALSDKELSDFFRQLGELTGAGITLVRALNIILQEDGLKSHLKTAFDGLLRSIRQGSAVSNAMEQQSGAFPGLAVNMLRAAEASGTLDQTSLRLAVYYDKQYRLKTRLKSATLYPRILCVLIVAAVACIMAFVMPQFQELFAQIERLPAPTRFLMWLSETIRAEWPAILAAAVILAAALRLLRQIPLIRLHWDKLALRLPLIGRQKKIICTAQFARTLSSLYAAGLSIVSALNISRKSIGNAYIESQLDQVLADVRGGGSLSDALDRVDGFTKKLTSAVRVGEESGTLDSMLLSVADALDYDSEQAMNRILGCLEPLLIVVMAAIVGFIMLAVIVPIYESYSAIESSAYQGF